MEESSAIHELRKDVREIKAFLVGSEYTENKGLIHDVHDIDSRLGVIEKRIDKWVWLVVGLSVGAGAGFTTVLQKVVDIFTHK